MTWDAVALVKKVGQPYTLFPRRWTKIVHCLVRTFNATCPNHKVGSNESKTLTAPASWSGRLWGRTYCTEDSSGNFSCITGDCGSGKLECSGSSGVPPVTFAEFTLRGDGGLDYFDVSLVDGFNLPLLVVPSHQNCTSIGCLADLNESCPSELRVTTSTEGKTVGCKSACLVTSLSMFCCTGTNNTPDTCKPSLYSLFFKNTCPQAYSYAYDDNNSTFRCASTDYQVTFCPGKYAILQFV
ncbi:hypothetical protein D5086_007816 [Populus alba]|uniref:Uncharacterized protein n=1 Tax=Populus alba TaxID=43335 RepID=A0ACC4CDX1_POPAL